MFNQFSVFKYLLVAVFITCISLSEKVCAQSSFNELMEGYVITHEMDTLYGSLPSYGDLLTPQECILQRVEDGVTTTTTYKAKDIYGFRFQNGKFFVSKVITLNDRVQTVFMEYLVNGIVSAYFYNAMDRQLYFIEDERGRLLPLSSDMKTIVENGQTYKLPDKKFVGMLKVAFQKSPKIVKSVEKFDLNKENIIQLTSDYHAEVCQTGQACILYEQDYKNVRDNTRQYRKEKFANFVNFHKVKLDNFVHLHRLGIGVMGGADCYNSNYHFSSIPDNLSVIENKPWSNSLFYFSGGLFLDFVRERKYKLRYEISIGDWEMSSYKKYKPSQISTRYYEVYESLHRMPLYNELSFKYNCLNVDKVALYVGVGAYMINYVSSDYDMKKYYSPAAGYDPLLYKSSTEDLFGLCDFGGTLGVQFEYLFRDVGLIQVDLKYKAGVSSEHDSKPVLGLLRFEPEPPTVHRFAQGINLTVGVGLCNFYHLKQK